MNNNPKIDVLYLCDEKACKNCSDVCEHTHDINHAIHKNDLVGRMFEYVVGANVIGFLEQKGETNV